MENEMKSLIQHFETFTAVAEHKSFTEAANELNVTKAAVSQSIRSLEASLQVPLFVRNTRSVSLTEEGELLLKQCQRLQAELALTKDMLTGLNSSPTGTLRISSNAYLAQSLLMSTLEQYIEEYPKMSVELLTEERMPNMQQEGIDIVFGINWPAPPDVVAKKIGSTRYVICASAKYLKNHGKPTCLKDLESHRYIPHLGRTADNIIAGVKKAVKLNLQSPLKLNNAYLMKQCALNGLGIIQVHEYMVRDELENGQLVEVLSDNLMQEIPLYIYYQKHRYVQPKIRTFVNLYDEHR